MKSFISIIYAKSSSFTEEKIAVGIILISDAQAKLVYSQKKIEIFEKLASNDVKIFLLNTFMLFENKIKEINLTPKKDHSLLSEDFFSYLNKYSQGLLAFDKLKPINLDILEDKNLDEVLLNLLGEKGIKSVENF